MGSAPGRPTIDPTPPDHRQSRVEAAASTQGNSPRSHVWTAKYMSRHETPMIRWYWEQVGGTLCEEFQVAARRATAARRLLDAVILPDGPKQKAHWSEVSIVGRDVIVVQAKASRLGMYLMGQALFSAELVKRLGPRSVRSVALCRQDDSILRPLLEQFSGCSVVVVPERASAGESLRGEISTTASNRRDE